MALIAWSPPPRAPIGIGRYVRVAADFDAAELAVAIVDEWQRRGVGLALTLALRDHALRDACAARRDPPPARLDAPRQCRAKALARRLGPVDVVGGDGAVVEVVIALEGLRAAA